MLQHNKRYGFSMKLLPLGSSITWTQITGNWAISATDPLLFGPVKRIDTKFDSYNFEWGFYVFETVDFGDEFVNLYCNLRVCFLKQQTNAARYNSCPLSHILHTKTHSVLTNLLVFLAGASLGHPWCHWANLRQLLSLWNNTLTLSKSDDSPHETIIHWVTLYWQRLIQLVNT